MALVTLTQLIAGARSRADKVVSQAVTDAEFTRFINNEYTQLFDLLIQKFEDWAVKEPPASIFESPPRAVPMCWRSILCRA